LPKNEIENKTLKNEVILEGFHHQKGGKKIIKIAKFVLFGFNV
jgi:hypothetical protein